MGIKNKDTKDYPSTELLNAFLDNELCAEDRHEIHEILERNASLKKETCELNTIKQLVREAYPEPQAVAEGSRHNWHSSAHKSWTIAASVVLGILVASVWNSVAHRNASETHAQATEQAAAISQAPIVSSKRIVFDLNTADVDSINEMFGEIEYLMNQPSVDGAEYEIHVIAHGEGLSLLQADSSPHPELIRDIRARYDNVTFAACYNTINRLQHEQGIAIKLLPGIIVIDSGVAEVIRRQQSGWAYIRV